MSSRSARVAPTVASPQRTSLQCRTKRMGGYRSRKPDLTPINASLSEQARGWSPLRRFSRPIELEAYTPTRYPQTMVAGFSTSPWMPSGSCPARARPVRSKSAIAARMYLQLAPGVPRRRSSLSDTTALGTPGHPRAASPGAEIVTATVQASQESAHRRPAARLLQANRVPSSLPRPGDCTFDEPYQIYNPLSGGCR